MQQIKDLEARLDQLVSENRLLAAAKVDADKELEGAHLQQGRIENESQKAVSAREQALQETAAELDKFKEAVGARERALQEKHAELEEFKAAVSARGLALQEKDAELERLKEVVRARELALQEKDVELEKLKGMVRARELTLQEKDVGLEKLKEVMSTRELALQERGGDLEKLKEAVGAQELALQGKYTELEELQRVVGARERALQEKDAELEKLKEAVGAKERALQEKDAGIEKLKGVVGAQQLTLQDKGAGMEKLKEVVNARELALQERDVELEKAKKALDWMQSEVKKLTEVNEGLASANQALAITHGQLELQHNEKQAHWQESARELEALRSQHEALATTHGQLELQHNEKHAQWQETTRELETLRSQHEKLSSGMEEIVRHEIDTALAAKNAELGELYSHLETAKGKIKELQQQILASRKDEVIVARDADYFDGACQQLCQHVQQWVLRFSKFSDTRICRTTDEVRDDSIVERFDNAVVDGSDVDLYLGDRIRRRDVFMSVIMTMIWEFIFSRYLFGMDREQRQKLKHLEKNLLDVGPRRAVHHWRATTLTLLSRSASFQSQRAKDTEAVVQEIFGTLARFLPPPQNLEKQLLDSLRNVMKMAVDLSIEMRTQRAEYTMLPPLRPEYDLSGEVKAKFYFNASLMNERSGESTSNEELEAQRAVVRMVLFPLVVKKGGDAGGGDSADDDEDEIVVCPAQVLVARDSKPKLGKKAVSSDRMSVDQQNVKWEPSAAAAQSTLDMSNVI